VPYDCGADFTTAKINSSKTRKMIGNPGHIVAVGRRIPLLPGFQVRQQ
jgi:hypothetical protein